VRICKCSSIHLGNLWLVVRAFDIAHRQVQANPRRLHDDGAPLLSGRLSMAAKPGLASMGSASLTPPAQGNMPKPRPAALFSGGRSRAAKTVHQCRAAAHEVTRHVGNVAIAFWHKIEFDNEVALSNPSFRAQKACLAVSRSRRMIAASIPGASASPLRSETHPI
jgi:hypothetical protein